MNWEERLPSKGMVMSFELTGFDSMPLSSKLPSVAVIEGLSQAFCVSASQLPVSLCPLPGPALPLRYTC